MLDVKELLISQIQVGEHRKRTDQEDEEIRELAASIKSIGVLEPVIVTSKEGIYTLVAGHRRIAACAFAGLSVIPAIIRSDDKAIAAEVSLAENFFRRDLSPVELASAIRECIDNGVMTIEVLAKAMHRSQQWICDQAKMTTWAPEILQAIHFKHISVSAGRNLAAIDDAQYRAFLLKNAVENGVTARVTAAWLQAYQLSRPPEEALQKQPEEGPQPAALVIPQSACMFCCMMFRTDALNYMPVCGTCLAKYQQAQQQAGTPQPGG